MASPSSRRAWIEIPAKVILEVDQDVALLAEGVDRNDMQARDQAEPLVALLAEGVDRNYMTRYQIVYNKSSPSSRRAWIEIRSYFRRDWVRSVALLAEGVDRNNPRCGQKS